MRYYRIYLLDADGHIERVRDGMFNSDAATIFAAGRVIGDHPAVDIWQQARRVARLTTEELARYREAAAPKPIAFSALMQRQRMLLARADAVCRTTATLIARTSSPGHTWADPPFQTRTREGSPAKRTRAA